MANAGPIQPGTIAWADLTVKNAAETKEFYETVVGWSVAPVDMGGYSDYAMNLADGTPAVGVCHARGINEDLPPVWLLYVIVESLDRSIEKCKALGGSVITGPKQMGKQGRFCVIKDPAGAMIALYEVAKQ